MTSCLRVVLLLLFVAVTLGQEGFDLFDALDDHTKAPEKPKEQPKAPEKPKSDDGFGFDLGDALGPDKTPTEKPKKPSSGDTGGGFDLGDALGPDTDPKPDKPAVKPPKPEGGGGSFSDSDLFDIGGGGNYKPDGGNTDGGHAKDPANDPHGGSDQPQEAGSGKIAGIVSAVGIALAGAAGSYFAYQKKKLCFKLQGGVDPESGKGAHGTHSDPQVLSNLLRTN